MSEKKPEVKHEHLVSPSETAEKGAKAQEQNQSPTATTSKPAATQAAPSKPHPILNREGALSPPPSSAGASSSNSSNTTPQVASSTPSNAVPAVVTPHQKQPAVQHAHFKLDDVVGHSASFSRSRSPSESDHVNEAMSNANLNEKEEEMPAERVCPSGADPRLPENDGKLHILLGSTGSVSTGKLKQIIYKLEDIYGKDKVSIQLMLTKAARGFVRKQDIPPQVAVWKDEDEWTTWKNRGDPVLHIELRKWADILVVAPLTANTLGKIALGLCDNLLTNVVRAWNTAHPMLIAPAMLSYAYNHPATKRHLKVIKEDMKWIEVLKPVEKVVGTFGDIGMGGMMDWNEIVDRIVMKLGGYPEEEDEDDDDEQKDLEADEDDEDDEEEESSMIADPPVDTRERRGSM